jgi:hypothetical protein
LNEELHIIDALRGPNLTRWLDELDHEHQKTFESLVMAVLLLLQGTGIDRKGQNFIIACAQPNLPFQCFKVPTSRESYWARILADSEETATFAYITTTCLETDQVCVADREQRGLIPLDCFGQLYHATKIDRIWQVPRHPRQPGL